MNIDWTAREHDDPFLTGEQAFEIDRFRLLHCTAWRRLAFKTQVFIPFQDDHRRMRMTHSLEAGQVARRLAHTVGANYHLAEVAALAHDVGHAPFGHAGERTLDRLMQGHGGFEHNNHTLRTLCQLEHPFPPFRGLNLTLAVRACLAQHHTEYDRAGKVKVENNVSGLGNQMDSLPPLLEARLVDLADRLAYGLGDLEDGIGAGLVTAEHLKTIPAWQDAIEACDLAEDDLHIHAVRRPALDALMHRCCLTLADHFGTSVRGNKPLRDAADVWVFDPESAQHFDAAVADLDGWFAPLEHLLVEHVYRHESVAAADAAGDRVITQLFEAHLADPALLPQRYHMRLDEQSLQTVVCDYIAGMTDRFCVQQLRRIAPDALR